MDVVAISTPPENGWRWRIVNDAGDVVEESRGTFTTIGAAVASGAARLPAVDVVPPPRVAHTWRRSTSGLPRP